MARPARIDRLSVLTEALALTDEAGLDALTMAAVATRMGVTPMALYRHVANKADLIDGVIELLLVEAVLETDAPVDGLDRLAAYAHRLRATARRHPAAFALLLQRPATTEHARGIRGEIARALTDVGLPASQADQLQRLLSTAVLGFALSEISGRFDAQTADQRDLDFELLLALLTDAVRSQLRRKSA